MLITEKVIKDFLRKRSLDSYLVERKKEIEMLLSFIYPVKANVLTGMPSGNLIEKPVERHFELLENLKFELIELTLLQTCINLVVANLTLQEKIFFELRYIKTDNQGGENTIKAIAIRLNITEYRLKQINKSIIEKILKKYKSKINQYCLI